MAADGFATSYHRFPRMTTDKVAPWVVKIRGGSVRIRGELLPTACGVGEVAG